MKNEYEKELLAIIEPNFKAFDITKKNEIIQAAEDLIFHLEGHDVRSGLLWVKSLATSKKNDHSLLEHVLKKWMSIKKEDDKSQILGEVVSGASVLYLECKLKAMRDTRIGRYRALVEESLQNAMDPNSTGIKTLSAAVDAALDGIIDEKTKKQLKDSEKIKIITNLHYKEVKENEENEFAELTNNGELCLSENEIKSRFTETKITNKKIVPNKKKLQRFFSDKEVAQLTDTQKHIFSTDFICRWIDKGILTVERAKALTKEQFERLRNYKVNVEVEKGFFNIELAKHHPQTELKEAYLWSAMTLSKEPRIAKMVDEGIVPTKDVFNILSPTHVSNICNEKILDLLERKEITIAGIEKLSTKGLDYFLMPTVFKKYKTKQISIEEINNMAKNMALDPSEQENEETMEKLWEQMNASTDKSL